MDFLSLHLSGECATHNRDALVRGGTGVPGEGSLQRELLLLGHTSGHMGTDGRLSCTQLKGWSPGRNRKPV